MRPLVKLFMVFCLLGIVLSRPLPEGEEEDAEESQDAANDESQNTDDAGNKDGGEEASEGGDEATSKDGGEGGDEATSEDGGEETSQGGDDADDKAGGDENAEGSKDEADGGKQESTGGNDGDDNAGKDAGSGENDPVNTYNKVVALLNKDVQVDNIQSGYLRSALNNDLQTEVRNPVIEAIGRIGSYTKIQECFASLGSDVKKVIDEEEKAFKDCMKEKKNEYQCSEDSFASAKGKLSPITSNIKSCVSSKGR